MNGPQEYRKRGVVVEAWQLTRENGPLVWEWSASKAYYEADGQVGGLSVCTPAGRVKAEFGDWVIRGAGSGFRVLPPEQFAAEYEPPLPSLQDLRERIAAGIANWDDDGGCALLEDALFEALAPLLAAPAPDMTMAAAAAGTTTGGI